MGTHEIGITAQEKDQQGTASCGGAKKLALGLGCFSIGLGLAELLAPEKIAKISGVRRSNTKLIRLCGLREIAAGIGIFASSEPVAAMWSRVAGDALDLASLGKAFASTSLRRRRLAFATANVAAVTALDVLCAKRLSIKRT